MPIIIYLYSEIFDGEAARVLAQLNADPDAAVEVHLNSPGGLVSEGLAIYNALRPRRPTVYIDGVVASIATLIAMSGQRIIAAENSLLMVHNPAGPAFGDANEMRLTADVLDKFLDVMLIGYTRTGLSEKQLREMLAAETWMTAQEALELGFVDEVAEPLRYVSHSPACYAGYHHVPEELLMPDRVPRASANPPVPAAPIPAPAAAASPATAPALMPQQPQAVAPIALADRNAVIASTVEAFSDIPGVANFAVRAMSDPAMTLHQFNSRLLAMVGNGATPLNPASTTGAMHAAGGNPSGDDFVSAASDALAMQVGIRIDNPHPGARDVAGMGLHGIVRACVQRSGGRHDLTQASRGDLVRAALSSSDFPLILENTLGKVLRAGYAVEPATYNAWSRRVLVPDFKLQSRVILGSAPELELVPELGEYTHGSFEEDKSVPYKVDKYGKLVQFSWEALINDDLGAFSRMVQALGQAAARKEGDHVYSTFAENAGAGPTMQDNATLFHANHANLATPVAGLSAEALGSARVLLRKQTAVGGGVLNLAPRFLLVSPEHEQAAETLLAASARSLSQGSENALMPAWLSKLELVVEARLSDSAFYLLASPDQVDTLERAWLEADNGPKIEEESSFKVDARTYKVRHVFGSRWLDWRGVVKVPVSG